MKCLKLDLLEIGAIILGGIFFSNKLSETLKHIRWNGVQSNANQNQPLSSTISRV